MFLLTFRDATFGELPTSMDTESSNGKEGMVTLLDFFFFYVVCFILTGVIAGLLFFFFIACDTCFPHKLADYLFDRKQQLKALRLLML